MPKLPANNFTFSHFKKISKLLLKPGVIPQISANFLCLLFLVNFLFFPIQAYTADPTIVIHWSTVTIENDPDLLKDRNGLALSAGAGGNGNGYIATLGYFDEANTSSLANHFKGAWTPMTTGTRVGDSSTGYGFSDGMFSFTTVFRKFSDQVVVFPYEPASYTLTAPFPITSTAPRPGTPICIRFYDGTEINPSARYNTVTGADWVWPAFSGGIPENLYLKISSGSPHQGSDWKYGSYFEDSDHNFTASKELQSILSINISGHGSVNSLNPTYNYAEIVNIFATPDPHMEFVGWLGSGVSQSQQQQTTVEMTADRNLTAVFRPKSYNLTVSTQGQGSVTGGGLHSYGSTVVINAVPANGYAFSHWLGYGPDSNNSNTTLTIQQDHAIVGVFNPIPSTLNVSSGIGGSALVVESAPYFFDGNYTINATPAAGYSFTHWSGSSSALAMLDSNITQLSSVSLKGNASYQANFLLKTYQLQVSMGEGGQTVSPATGDHLELSMVSVDATPLAGYQFVKWEDPSGILNDPVSASTEANMSKAGGNTSITATFSKMTYPLVINEGTGGNVSLTPSNGPWEHNGVYDLIAVAQSGYSFLNWSGEQNSTNALLFNINEPTNKVGVVEPIELTANFSKNQYSVQVQSTSGGNVTGTGTFTIDDTPTIEAIPQTGWNFSNWTGDLSYLVAPNAKNSLVNLTAAPLFLSYTANFARETYTLEVETEGNGLVNEKAGFTLIPDSGTNVSLNAVASTGSHFSGWYGYQVNEPKSPSISFTPNVGGKISALFELNKLHLQVNQSAGGEANGTGTYPYASTVSISSKPSPGYVFDRWTGDTQFLNDAGSFSLLTIPDQNLSITANFKPIPFSVLLSSTGLGSVSGGGTFDSGATASLSAQPAGVDESAPRGHQLEKWTWSNSDGITGSSTDNPLNLLVDSNYSVVANFTPIPPNSIAYNLVSSPSTGGALFDDPASRTWNIATDLIERTISATPNSGFSFLGWTSSETLVFSPSWKSPQVIASPVANSTITSNFVPITQKIILTYDSSKGTVAGGGLNLPSLATTTISSSPKENYEFSEWIIKNNISYEVTRKSSSINDSGTKLFIDGMESPSLTLVRGFTYSFACNLSEEDSFYLSTSQNGNFVGEYLNGVSNSRASSGVFTITIPADAPNTLYYHGSADEYSGNVIKIISKTSDEILPFPNNPIIENYLEHDVHLEAKFVGRQFALSFNSGVGGSIRSPVSNHFASYGSTVVLSAVAQEHYQFVRWEGSDGIDNPFSTDTSLLVSKDASIRAVFSPILYDLNFVLTPSTGGNAFTSDNQYSFTYGSRVPIEVIPLVGNEFIQWSGNVEDRFSPSTFVNILGNTSVSVQFSETLISVSKIIETYDSNKIVMNQEGGSVSGGSSFSLGSTPNFSAFPKEGFEFVHWKNESDKVLSTTKDAKIQITGFSTLVAVFEQISHPVEVTTNPRGKGMVEWTNTGTGENLSANVPYGQTINLRAVPSNGYFFEKWTNSAGDLYKAGEIDLSISINSPMLINARFAPLNPVELTISTIPDNAGWTFGQGTFGHEPKHSIFAKPNPGYLFDYWEGEGISDYQLANSKINLNQDRSILARFKADPNYDLNENPVISELGLHNLTVVSSNSENGSVSGSGIFGTGWAEIKAHPNEGYEFIKWMGAEVEDNYLMSTHVFLAKDEKITGVFAEYIESIVSGSNQLDAGWWNSDWFGSFWNVNSKWSFHSDLGWINISSIDNESSWVWIQRLNSWCWTGRSSFPYFYLQNEEKWIWVDLTKSDLNSITYFLFSDDMVNGTWNNH